MNGKAKLREELTAYNQSFEIYPKRYFDLSPTWFAWIKLSAADIYSLRRERGFEGQKIFFHLNYPIRYADVIGVVVSIELIAAGRFTILQLDDSSGVLIEVKIAMAASPIESNTDVQNLRLSVLMGMANVFVGDVAVEVGHLLRVKGEMDEFRLIRQIIPKRMWTVKNTTEEVDFWRKMEVFKRDVLCMPWILDSEQRRKLDTELKKREAAELKRERKLEKLRKARESRECSKGKKSDLHDRDRPLNTGILKRQTRNEQKKQRIGATLMETQSTLAQDLDEGALEGSNVIRKPWD